MINSLYLPELREMLAENDSAGLDEFCTALHPARTAEFMEGLEAGEAWEVLQHADLQTRGELFSYFDEEKQLEIIETADQSQIGELIGELPSDDRVDLLKQITPERMQSLMPFVPVEERRDILRLQAYPEGTAGAVMTTQVAKLSDHLTVRQALDEVIRQAEELETVYYIYFVDDHDHLRGVMTARKLLSVLSKPSTLVSDVMERDIVAVNVIDDQETVASTVARYDLLAIPVVDSEHRLLGIVTHDDVIDVVREEAVEDAHRLGAVSPLSEGYLETPWMTLTWKRGMWLVFLFVGGLLTAIALQSYEGRLTNVAWLIFFIPLVISAGGNSGNQSATLVITAMTIGDVRLTDWPRVVRRELIVGFCLGALQGLIGFGAALLVADMWLHAIVIPITVILVVMSGTIIGSILPMMFSRLGLDPALMSNPFVASIIDLTGILIYMNVALLLI